MTAEVLEQIISIRDSGLVNMCDTRGVQRIAYEQGLYDLVNYIEDNRNSYFHFIICGEEPETDQPSHLPTRSFDTIADNIRIRLLPNDTKKTDDTILHAGKLIKNTGLIICFFLEKDSQYTPVTSADIHNWNTTEEDLLNYAILHGGNDYILKPIEEILGDPTNPQMPQITVVTNKAGRYGAATVLYPIVRENLDKIYPTGYWLVPSSVHEMIAIPSNLIPAADVLQIIADVNKTIILPADYLSNKLFRTDSENWLAPIG